MLPVFVHRSKHKRQSGQYADRSFIFILLVVLAATFFSSIAPASAAQTCCRCSGPADSDKSCLTIDSSKLSDGQRVTAACSRLVAAVGDALKGWTCEPEPLSSNKCNAVPQGVCQKGPPVDAFTAGGNSEAVTKSADATKPPEPAVIPLLNTPIPDFSFTGSAVTKDTSSLLAQYVAGVYGYAISIVALAATVMFTWGAFQYLLGSALPSISRGKTIMQEAVLGMILVLSAHLILRTINPATLTLEALYIEGVSIWDLGNYNPAVRGPGTLSDGPPLSISKEEVARQLYEGARMVEGVDPCMVLAVCQLESGFRPIWNGYPKNPKEKAGAFGPCQMQPRNLNNSSSITASIKRYFPDFPPGAERNLVADWLLTNMKGAGFASALMLRMQTSSGGDNEAIAVTSYAAGEGSIRKWREANGCRAARNVHIKNISSGDLLASCIPSVVGIPTLGEGKGCPDDRYVCGNIRINEKNEFVGTCSNGKMCYAMKTDTYANTVIKYYPSIAARFDCSVKPGNGFIGTPVARVTGGGSHPALQEGDRVLLVGDSLSVGLTGPLGTLARNEKLSFSSGPGESGSTLTDWAPGGKLHARLQNGLAQRPRVVFISLGTNDAYFNTAAAQAEFSKIDAIIKTVKDSGASLIWIGPPTLPATSNGNNKNNIIIPAIQSRVPTADYFPSDQYTFGRAPDQIHATGAGYSTWASQLWNWY